MKTVYILTLAAGGVVVFPDANTAWESLCTTYAQFGKTMRCPQGVRSDCFTVNELPIARGEAVDYMPRADHL